MSILAKKLLASSNPTYVTLASGAGTTFYYYNGANQISYSFSLDYTDSDTGLDVRPFIVLWARTNEISNPYVVSLTASFGGASKTFNKIANSTVWHDGAGYYDIFEVWVCTEELNFTVDTNLSFTVTWHSTNDMNTFQATSFGIINPKDSSGVFIQDSDSNGTTSGVTLTTTIGSTALAFGFWANSTNVPSNISNLYSIQVTDIETTDFLWVAAIGDIYNTGGGNMNVGLVDIDSTSETVNLRNDAAGGDSRHLFAISFY